MQIKNNNPDRIFPFSEFKKRLFVFTLQDKHLHKKFVKHLIDIYGYNNNDAAEIAELFIKEYTFFKKDKFTRFIYFEQGKFTFKEMYFPSSYGVPSIERKLYNLYLEGKAWKE